jgi:hypothetical protein
LPFWHTLCFFDLRATRAIGFSVLGFLIVGVMEGFIALPILIGFAVVFGLPLLLIISAACPPKRIETKE